VSLKQRISKLETKIGTDEPDTRFTRGGESWEVNMGDLLESLPPTLGPPSQRGHQSDYNYLPVLAEVRRGETTDQAVQRTSDEHGVSPADVLVMEAI